MKSLSTIAMDPSARSVLQAIFAMGLLTFVMMLWMTVTRTGAMHRLGIGVEVAARTADLPALLPRSATQVADNYNNLMEAPTLFYATALAVVIGGIADPIQAASAWAFFAARGLHSLVQATVNIVRLRGPLFGLSWLALAVMIVHGGMTL